MADDGEDDAEELDTGMIDEVKYPWTAHPGSRPCMADAPEALKRQHGRPLVCTRPKGHDGDHVVGPDLVRWEQ